MDEIRKHRLWLSVALVGTAIIFATVSLALVMWVPSIVETNLGKPDPNLSMSRSIYLSAQLFIRTDALLTNQRTLDPQAAFVINAGSSAAEIAQELEQEHFIRSADDVLLYWEYKGKDRFVRDGVYLIEPNSSPKSIADELVTGETGYSTFAFLPGWRKEEIDTLLVQSELAEQPLHILLGECRPEFGLEPIGIEGFLSPGSYQIPVDASNRDIYCSFVERFFATLPDNFLTAAASRGLGLSEAVTLASIIEREVVDESEAARIAGVFYNRLSEGMPLQSDPTVQYAVASIRGGPNWWNADISKDDLLIDSPFNTYRVSGLPPAPICNPSLSALQAVADPENHNFFYFRAACDNSGSHFFSETYEQHLAASCG